MALLLNILCPMVVHYRLISNCRVISHCRAISQHNSIPIVVRRNVKNIICNAMLLHVATIAIEEHVVYLLLIRRLQLLLFNKVGLGFLKLNLELSVLLFIFRPNKSQNDIIQFQLANFSLKCLIFQFHLPQHASSLLARLRVVGSIVLIISRLLHNSYWSSTF